MRIKIAVVAMVVLALAACQRGERATVTGGYGTSVLSGVVVMGDGETPAGVNVTVKGVGMAAVLAADGRFAFAGAPEQAELLFDRAADGISASLQVEAAAGPVVVELAQGSAKKSGRRRGAGSGNPVSQFEGLVRSATATEVVVFTSKKVEQAIAITPETVIRRGNTILTVADLVPNARVHVKALKTETGGFNAFLITVQGGEADDSPEGKEFEGLVVSSSAGQLVIIDSRAVQQTFVVNAATVIRKGNTAVLPADIQPGWRVHVKATTNAADGVRTATRVTIQRTHGENLEKKREYEGIVISSSATQLVMTDSKGVGQTFVLDGGTEIRKGSEPVLPEAILPGWRVHVKAIANADGTKTATRVTVQNTGDDDDDDDGDDDGESGEVEFGGRVTAVAATSLTVQTDSGPVTVQTDASMKIEKNGDDAVLSAVVAGDKVKVEGTRVDASTVLAKRIEVK